MTPVFPCIIEVSLARGVPPVTLFDVTFGKKPQRFRCADKDAWDTLVQGITEALQRRGAKRTGLLGSMFHVKVVAT